MTDEPTDASSLDTEIVTAEIAPSETDTEPSPNERLAASRWQVLVLLFLAAGPLALPVLVRSPRFSRVWKVTLFCLVIVQTVLVVVLIVVFARWLLVQFEPLRQLR